MIQENGYKAELHSVITEDKYILNFHRIPPKQHTDKVVFFMHGLASSAADWILLNRGQSLPYLLADNGYDVWIGNARGTASSARHQYLNINSAEFWNFSWHEIAVYDLPAMMNDILQKTNQTDLHYIGHSQGGTTILVLLSTHPEYNSKLRPIHLLAPAIYFGHTALPFYVIVKKFIDEFELLMEALGVGDTFPWNTEFRKFATNFCMDPMSRLICREVLFLLFGRSEEQFEWALDQLCFILNSMSSLLMYTPASCSYKQFMHYGQLIKSRGRFQHFDHGTEKNLQLYKQKTPPQYNLSNVKTKMHMFYGANDNLVQPLDIETFLRKLKKYIVSIVKVTGWNHSDFIFAKDVQHMINEKILANLNRFSCKNNKTDCDEGGSGSSSSKNSSGFFDLNHLLQG